MKQKYVCGLLFSNDRQRVVLIHKKKGPSAVVGKWNAVGGKVEEGESSTDAMTREFIEESGVITNWTLFLQLSGEYFEVDFFHSFDNIAFDTSRTMEEEEIDNFSIKRLPLVVPNLRWIIPMALGHLDDHVLVYSVIEKEIT